MSGFILMHREIFDNPILKDGERFRAWLWLVSEACWRPTKFDIRGTIVELRRGQLCMSRDQLAKAWGWSPSAVERFLTRLQTEQMIGRETGQGRSVITICNYDKFQSPQDQAGQPTGQPTGQQSDSNRTAKEQGNKGTRVEEPNGPSTQGAGADAANRSDLFGGDPKSADAQKPVKRSRKAKAADEPVTIPDWVPLTEWNAFLEMRHRKGAVPTPHAVNLLIKHLNEFRGDGHDPGRVLDQSTIKNWTDIYPLKDRANERHGQTSGGAASGYSEPRVRRDGFSAAIDDALASAQSQHATGSAGQFDNGNAAGDQGLPSARVRVLR